MLKADYERNRNTIDHMITSVYQPVKPSVAQLNAMSNACALMKIQNVDERVINTMAYHIEHPEALVFRDKYTMAALRIARLVIDRKIERMERLGQTCDE